MKSTTKVAGVLAVLGAAALGVSLMGSGVGAAFTDSATANAHIAVGSFSCQLTSTDPRVTISNNGRTAEVNFATITSSTPATVKAPISVNNTGGIPLGVNFTITNTGTVFASGHVKPLPVASGLLINPGNSRSYDIGFQYSELDNTDLGMSGTASYKASCVEPQNSPPASLRLFSGEGGTATFSNGNVLLGIDQSNSSGYAGAQVLNPPSTLPTAAPTYTASNYAAGTPRYVIYFSDNSTGFGYPGGLWSVSNGPSTSYGQFRTQEASKTVTEVDILADVSQPASYSSTVSCINYGGTNQLGSGPCS